MVGKTLLTASHVLNIIPNRNKETAPYEIWVGRKPSLLYLRTWGCLAKVNVLISKKRKLGPKTVDFVFLGYAHRCIVYRFLVVKSEVPDMHVDTIFESCDATFFKNIFRMKDMCSNARFFSEITLDFTIPIESPVESFDQPLEEVLRRMTMKFLRGTRDEGLQNPLVMISLCILWMILIPLLQRHMHLQMQMIGKKLFIVR
jgi:hypothetical protein